MVLLGSTFLKILSDFLAQNFELRPNRSAPRQAALALQMKDSLQKEGEV
jgi:hypothetical protein